MANFKGSCNKNPELCLHKIPRNKNHTRIVVTATIGIITLSKSKRLSCLLANHCWKLTHLSHRRKFPINAMAPRFLKNQWHGNRVFENFDFRGFLKEKIKWFTNLGFSNNNILLEKFLQEKSVYKTLKFTEWIWIQTFKCTEGKIQVILYINIYTLNHSDIVEFQRNRSYNKLHKKLKYKAKFSRPAEYTPSKVVEWQVLLCDVHTIEFLSFAYIL